MFGHIARYAIFILFPILIAAIIVLGRISLISAQSFGRWGEKSIVESTYLLAQEKVNRVENEIISTDNAFFQIIDPSYLDQACIRWKSGIKSNLVEAAVIFDEFGDVVQFFHHQTKKDGIKNLWSIIINEIIPNVNYYDSFYQLKHYHWQINDIYRLITTYTTEYEGQIYTALLLYSTTELTGPFFRKLIEDVGKNRVINVVDPSGNIVFGNDMTDAGDFTVSKTFPTTLYKWKLQLAPVSAAYYIDKQEKAQISTWVLVPASFGIIVFGIVVLAMVWVRERRLNVLKSEFIANTSHELKTPLALIRMFSELLAMNQIDDKKKISRYHQIILRETERLTGLIDNVLDFAKIERGKNVYLFEKFNPVETIETALDIYQHRVENVGAKLVLNIKNNISSICGDQDAFTLVLLNLIDNAVKYASGTDIIGIDLYTREKYLYLDVYDRGQGIPSPQLKRIFDRFYRYQPSNQTNRQRGSGIGLSLVRHIAKAHGGNVSVSSTPGVETRFSVRFPLKIETN